MVNPVRLVAALLIAVALLVATFVFVQGGGPPAIEAQGRAGADVAAGRGADEQVAELSQDVAASVDGGAATRSLAAADEAAGVAAARGGVRSQVVGGVVDSAGAPVVEARVMASTRRSSIPLGLDTREVAPGGALPAREGTAEIARTETDEQGRFAVAEPPSQPELRVGRGLELLVRAPGFVPRRPQELPMGAVQPHDVGAITMRPGLTVQGTVRGPTGEGLEGVRLSFGQANLSGLAVAAAPTRGLPFAVTSEDGRFTCDELRPGRFWIIAAADGHAPARAEGSLKPGETLVGFDLQLERAVTIAGTCEGVPEGLVATVLAAATDDENAGAMERRWRELPIDPATGAFSRQAFVGGLSYDLRVALVDPLSGERDVTRAVERVQAVAPAEDVLLSWRPRTVVTGRVVVRTTGGDAQPHEHFMVAFAEGAPEGIDFDARTLEAGDEPKRRHSAGRFRFDDLALRRRGRRGEAPAERPMTFRVRAVGYEDLFLRGVTVKTGEVNDLGDLELVRGDSLAVRVVDAGGRPVPDARVYACDADMDRWFERWRGRDEPAWTSDTVRYGETGSDGIASLPLPPGEAVLRVGVNADGFVFARPLEAPRSEDEVVVTLARGASVVAQVTTESGAPAPGVAVQLVAEGESLLGPRRLDARTDEAGQARFAVVQPGEHRLTSAPPRMRPRPPASWKSQEVRIDVPEAGEVTASLSVRAVVEVTGRVLEAGAPVPGARVEFAVRDGEQLLRPDWRTERLRGIADADGRFTVMGVPVGSYDVGVAHEDRAMAARFEIEIAEAPLPLVLSLPDAVVAGKVVDADTGRPARGLRIRVEDLSGESRAYIAEQTLREEPDGDLERDSDWSDPGSMRTGRSGGFRFRGVATGEPLRIRVDGEFIRARAAEIPALGPGEVREDVTIEVRSAGSIEINLDRGPARRRSDLGIEIQRLDETDLPVGRTRSRRSRGRTRFDSLAPGKYRLRAGAREDGGVKSEATQDVEVTPGKRARVRMRVE